MDSERRAALPLPTDLHTGWSNDDAHLEMLCALVVWQARLERQTEHFARSSSEMASAWSPAGETALVRCSAPLIHRQGSPIWRLKRQHLMNGGRRRNPMATRRGSGDPVDAAAERKTCGLAKRRA